jgi:uncharacterized protein YqjF (DUF2071 family)
MTAAFLTAIWRDLVMVSYEVDPDVLRPLVPAGTELDLWGGRALVSMVGFRFLRTRVLGLAIPGHCNFEEVNLRFYVRRLAPEGWRRGVVFVKEIVPRFAIAWVARTLYNENYVALPMAHVALRRPDEAVQRIEYRWRQDRHWSRLGVAAHGRAALPAPESEAAFITEHYWGYARQRDGGTVEYRVEHPQWEAIPAGESTFECDVAALYGAPFAGFLAAPPSSAFLAAGSPVTVRRGVRLSEPHAGAHAPQAASGVSAAGVELGPLPGARTP